MSSPLISIILPVYNAGKWLSLCLDSVLAQTEQNFELIALNDGSKDNSLETLRAYEPRFPNIVIIDKPNAGLAATRNEGLTYSRGKYVTFIDQDDILLPDYLECLVTAAGDTYDVAMGGFSRIDDDGNVTYTRKIPATEWGTWGTQTAWGKLYRTDFIKSNHITFPNHRYAEDIGFWVKIHAANPKITVVPAQNYLWRDNPLSMSNTEGKGFQDKGRLIGSLNEGLAAWDGRRPPYLQYMLKRCEVYHLLYSGRSATAPQFLAEYARFNEFLSDNDVKSKICPLSPKLKGEPLNFRLAVAGFSAIERLHLVKVFAKFYCKGA